MEAIGEGVSGTFGRGAADAAAMPARRATSLRSVPDSGAFPLASLAGAPALTDTNVDGGAAAADSAFTGGVFSGGAMANLRRCRGLLEAAVESAREELALAGFAEAADFAGLTEEISRRFEYLQVLGAAAVDRTRTEAISNAAGPAGKAAGWITGWGHDTESSAAPSGSAAFEAEAASPEAVAASASVSGPAAGTGAVSGVSPADDGCRNTAEFLRVRLRISTGEARRRLALASAVLPRTGITGLPQPPVCEETAAALGEGSIASRAGTIITTALDRVRHIAAPEDLARMEHVLTRTAIENDQDFLTRVTHRWADAIDQDGTEPSEEDLRHRQGAFLRRHRRGLHHLEIFATPEQYEHLLTVMNTATNPRTQPTTGPGTGEESSGDGGDGTDVTAASTGADTNEGTGAGAHAGPGFGAAAENAAENVHLERRTRPQQLLDGLVGACKAALAAGCLPATGGLRPQIMATISYQDLLNRLETAATNGPRYTTTGNPGPGAASGNYPGSPAGPLPGTATGTGTFTYTGPVTPATIRKIACDADIIPIL
ncbi:13E12 repeat family protein, partial [Arthrobacter sp. ZGTC131]|uniref:13E12 repeat family protein n=1 Tax=Arthrobacter sp. ZGTC131 TaxID=2058898 RepID=UPI0021589B54